MSCPKLGGILVEQSLDGALGHSREVIYSGRPFPKAVMRWQIKVDR